MHLTRLSLELRSAAARRDLGDVYDMHRTLSRAFVSNSDEKPGRFLWRVEPASASRAPLVLVQSESAPDWSFLCSLPGYLAREPEVKTWDPARLLELNAKRRFRLVANPTVTRDGKRQGIVQETEQLDWLSRQGTKLGFAVEMALVTDSDFVVSRSGQSLIQFQRACYDGILSVQDPSRLLSAMSAGVGPAKAFGCGLLTVAAIA
ncbi:type I-E CRISPR-associated protein Cas6/Cse3/CasE [Aquabacterium lacunae]|uniref:Type I-E CRISPR-associated protein Cas6/Cse3/CasE n=1 Tax=Aquabacterium lacunae TaxID=2528630 RepID=A0A4Q9GVR3_9BURK|nr:type I-E CRISPR-associated protein Cas6/Cse3/CasE [Aquabacterium lacunae]TBO27942.1 type I-E CRISPR-associated protein Cas6/Cse3/CasE [Aquabacterium lacunae]